MRRPALFGLLATVLVASAAPAFSQPATPASAPAAQPFRKLEYSRIGGWEIAAIGNDEKVNHCILTRGTSSADPKPGEPKFAFAVDQTWAILQLRTADFKYTEKKGLPVTVTTADGSESQPLAATGGPDLANIRFATPTELNPLLATKHLDVRVEDSTVRLSFAGLAEVRAEFDQCMANIGSPAKGWSKDEFEQILKQVKRGTAKCTTNKRTNVTMCDTD